MAKKRVLVVDDERNMQAVLKLLFDGEGYEARCVSDGVEALEILASDGDFGAVVSDFKMNRLDGMGLLKAMRERGIRVPFVLITAYGTVEKAVEAMKLGAVDVVTKPFAKEALLAIVARAFRFAPGEEHWRKEVAEAEGLVYRSPAMAEIGRLLERVGPAAAPVLLTGESGTGKEVLARAIHRAYAGGQFESKPFVSVNCPAVPESLLESELFGYRKGAFTGADQDFKGKVEQADGGSLFFDEIGDLPASIQPKLLRLLENRTFEALGSGRTRDVDIRIICATNRKLDRLVSEGRFREDLFYRINTFTIEMPPLRERHEDIKPLADYLPAAFRLRGEKGRRHLLAGSRALHPRLFLAGQCARAEERHRAGSHPQFRHRDTEPTTFLGSCAGASQSGESEESQSRAQGAEFGCLLRLQRGPSRAPSDPSSSTPSIAPTWNVSAASRILGVTRNTLRYRLRKYGLETGRARWFRTR